MPQNAVRRLPALWHRPHDAADVHDAAGACLPPAGLHLPAHIGKDMREPGLPAPERSHPQKSVMDHKAVLKSLRVLRDDALSHRPQMDDLAIAYGWSMIRIGQEILGRPFDDARVPLKTPSPKT